MKITVPVVAGSEADIALRRQLLNAPGAIGPLRIVPNVPGDRGLDWPHSVILGRSHVPPGPAVYTIKKIETCSCGKPMHPLPFECEDCMACAFELDGRVGQVIIRKPGSEP